MAHKFVPRKGFNRKDKEQAADQTPSQTPAPVPADEAPTPAPPPPPEDNAAEEEAPSPIAPKAKERSAKDSILKKLPGKGLKKPSKLDPKARKPVDRPAAGGRGGLPMMMLVLISVAVFLLVGGGFAVFMLGQVAGYRGSVNVSAATRLDWTYVEARHSLEKPPPGWTGHDSLKGRYELYVPPEANPSQPSPMILFISNDARPAGWSALKQLCIEKKIIFASPHAAGDDVPLWQRTRAVLDVLDDVRRNPKCKVDPDRTYLAGFWGGARQACRIAFALPELFGGVVAIGGGDLIRDDPWLRYRVGERLSVAWVTADKDPCKAEVLNLHFKLCQELKIRTKEWIIEGQPAPPGRAIPPPAKMAEIFQWLEDGLKDREELAKKYPGSRLSGDEAPSRPDWAKAYFFEAQQRLEEGKDQAEKPDIFLSGIAQLSACRERWKGLLAAQEAQREYQKWNSKENKRPWGENGPAWDAEEHDRQRTYELTLARLLTEYLSNHAQIDYAEMSRFGWMDERHRQWVDMVKKDLWPRLAELGTEDQQKEANKQLAAIQAGLFTPPPAPAVPTTSATTAKK
jgi:hypothetical protein